MFNYLEGRYCSDSDNAQLLVPRLYPIDYISQAQPSREGSHPNNCSLSQLSQNRV